MVIFVADYTRTHRAMDLRSSMSAGQLQRYFAQASYSFGARFQERCELTNSFSYKVQE